MGKLATKAAFLHAAEGHARVAGAKAVDKHPAALQFAGEFIRKRCVSGKDGGGQAKVAVVGKRQGVLRVFATVTAATGPNSSGGTPSSTGDVRQHGWRVVITLSADFLSAQQQRCPFGRWPAPADAVHRAGQNAPSGPDSYLLLPARPSLTRRRRQRSGG